jgi:NAD kinase
MSLAPRAVLVHRRTELEELLARHGTRGQAAFFLSSRGRSPEEVEARHSLQQAAMAAVTAAIPLDWRRGVIERADLPRFLFAPDDVVVVVGQDGLVANVARYLDGQPVIGINPDPSRNPGVLVRHAPAAAADLLRLAAGPRTGQMCEERTMVQARLDDGQTLKALNEVFVGQATHQTARYVLGAPDGRTEHQGSSGVIIATGTGATGWCRSAWLERHSPLELPTPGMGRLTWFVREAWPSPATGTALTEGSLGSGEELRLTVASDRLVCFGDGMEADALQMAWGQTVRVATSDSRLRLVKSAAALPPHDG